MFEYERVGKVAGVDSGNALLLPAGRPLSYLRVGEKPEASRGLSQALLEAQTTELRVRIPVVVERGASERVAAAMRRFAVSPVFPVLDGIGETGKGIEICWLDLVQVAALRRQEGAGLA
ncbi:MAG TPA: hypothetical protein VNC15_07920, partial [Solirubrobacterales bacterium]|nr:hypothetical protein [Solirubrobacterales bacterium]